ncbi:MAG: glycine-rich domain-containing protein, partial [Opitutaceae bacterium]
MQFELYVKAGLVAEVVATRQAPVVVYPGLTIEDPDSATLSSATVSITGSFVQSEDALGFVSSANYGNITGSYDATAGVLTLTSAQAQATVAQWQAALRSITYTNSSGAPNTASRTVSFVINDGEASGPSANVIIKIALKVTFDAKGGSAVADGASTLGGSVAIPSSPTRSGYTFAGWALPNTSAVTDPGSLSGLYSRFKANDYNGAAKVWPDSSGNGRNITSARIGGSPTLANSAAGNGNAVSFPVVAGGTSTSIRYTTAILPSYTLFTVARYSGGSRGRIFNGDGQNWLAGFYGGMRGVAHFNGWLSNSSSNLGTVTHWLASTSYPSGGTSYYRADGVERGSGGSYHSLPLLVTNTGSNAEASDYEIAEVLIYDRVLTSSEIAAVERYIGVTYGLSFANGAVQFPYVHGKTSDFTMEAVWNVNSIAVTFDSQGGSAVSNFAWTPGSRLTLPTPTKAGFGLMGWYDAVSEGNKIGDGGAVYTPANTTAFTLYARWGAPSLNSVNTLVGAAEDTNFTITDASLLAASDATVTGGGTPSFRIEGVTSGVLTKNGVAVTPGSTLLGPGESLVWRPAADANGTLNAFTIKAVTPDNAAASATAVQVSVNVAAVNDAPLLASGLMETRQFNTSGTFTPMVSGTIEALIVGGGGGGAGSLGGGGGGGGVVHITAGSVVAGVAYPIVVGEGGAPGTKGQASTAFGATADGGGTSGTHDSGDGTAGGSGGGAASNNSRLNQGGPSSGNSLGANTGFIYGNRGGHMTATRTGDPTRAAGGGGAGGQGKDTNSNTVGDTGRTGDGSGGVGIANSILGTEYYWGGGGGGGAYNNQFGGYGGLGGGGGAGGNGGAGLGGGSALNSGANGSGLNGGAGGANTGGGGGGGAWSGGLGARGGSGVVIVRFQGSIIVSRQVPLALLSGLTLSDVDSSSIGSAKVSITGGFVGSEDVLGYVNTASHGNIAGSYDATNGVLTLTSEQAQASLAQWQEALRSVTYTNTSSSPNTGSRTVSFVVYDGAAASLPVNVTVLIGLKVSYDTKGGSVIADGATTSGGTITASPGTPTRAGYSFAGWVVPGGPADPGSLTGLYSRFKATDYNAATKVWTDSSGNTRNITSAMIGGSPALITSAAGNGSSASFPVVAGGTSSSIKYTATTLPNYTLFTVARYAGSSRGRIFNGDGQNWLAGFWNGSRGVAHFNSWLTGATANVGTVTDWLLSTSYPSGGTSYYRADGVQRGTGGSYHNLPLLTTNTSEPSDYQIAEVLIYDRVLAANEIAEVERYLSLTYGLSAARGFVQFPYAHGKSTDFTLEAVWTGNSNMVMFEPQGGSAVNSITWTTGSQLTLPSAPTRSGYYFNGWYSAATGGNRVGSAGATYSPTNTADFTLYAQWVVPLLGTVSTLAGGNEDTNYTITYAALLAASDASVPNNGVPSFRVDSVTTGTLTKSGVAVTAGSTLLGPNESLVWRPATDANGTLNAFTVRSANSDGSQISMAAVQVRVDVAAQNDSPTISVGGQSTVSLPAVAEDTPSVSILGSPVSTLAASFADADSISQGIADVSGVGRTYVDQTTDGGGWVLLAYGANASLAGYLDSAFGSFDATTRTGSASLATRDILRAATDLAFSWTGAGGSLPTGPITSYPSAVAFSLPNPAAITATGATSPSVGTGTENFSRVGTSSEQSLVALRVLAGSPGLPTSMYLRNVTFGVNYGSAYGLVNNDGGNPQLDWSPDRQNFSAIYLDHPGGGASSGYVTTSGMSGYVPSTMAVWAKLPLAQPKKGVAIVGVDSGNGVWEYSLDAGTSWQSLVGVSASAARLLQADNAAHRIRFIPAKDFSGTATASYRYWDQTSGTAGSTANVTTNGGTSAFSASLLTLSAPVTAVNDAPTLATFRMLYETTTPTRDGSGAIVYTSGFGTGINDAAAKFDSGGAQIARVRYRMELTINGVARYAEATFDAWPGLKATDLRVPALDKQENMFVLQRDVSNLSVESNVSTVSTGSGFLGRLEIWPWNYESRKSGLFQTPGSDDSLYDFDDYPSGSPNYGSFQVHDLTNLKTVLAWNRHYDPQPDIGFGNAPQGMHPDWTFNQSNGKSGFKLQIWAGESGVPQTFTVTEDLAGNLLYSGTPFSDVDSTTLTVTLSVSDGTITGSADQGITVGGSATVRTFSGTTANLNAYFTTAGKITYQGALNNTSKRTLTTTVSDGSLTSSTTSTIEFTPVNDAPTLAVNGGVTAGSGGSITASGMYTVHTFTQNGSFVPSASGTVEVLVVGGGGGGGGGNYHGGGGGGGGVVSNQAYAVEANTPIAVVVGAGGAMATKGGDSSFGTLSAVGGGSGGRQGVNGGSGGSGGGSGYFATGGAGTTGQGYAGAFGVSGGAYGSGGGGGAGAAGSSGTTSAGGAGGVGVASSISGVTSYYGGGGGGSAYAGPAGTGGSGGGGAGSRADQSIPAQSGQANTGGGGGGAERNNTLAGSGGSGVVIVRYLSGDVLYADTSATDVFPIKSGTLNGSDVDSATLTYGISGGTEGSGVITKAGTYGTLAVTTSTGAYTYTPNAATINALAGGVTASDVFTVTVTDGVVPNPTEATLTVNVTGANDAPTNIALSATSIAENNAANATVGTLTASDVDAGATHTFSLVAGTGDTDNGAFNISGNSLRLTGSANFEVKNSYSVRVRATDNGGLTFEKQFTITVTDVNEAPTLAAIAVNGTEDTTLAFTAANFTNAYSDIEGTALASITVVTLPVTGTLKLNGTSVVPGQVIPVSSLSGIPSQGLVGRWSFDSAADLGKNAVTGAVLTNSGAANWSANGRSGGAVDLNGSSWLYSSTGTIDNLPVGVSTYSVALWFKARSFGAKGFVGWGSYGATNQVNAFRLVSSNQLVNYWWDRDLNASVGEMSSQSWYHVVATYDGSKHAIYFNGVEKSSRSPSPPNVQPVNFGIGKTVGNEYFDGLIDEVLIYSRALSATEIAALAADTVATGGLVYEPSANDNGAKTFTVTASDGALSSSAATVTINLTAVNDAPVVIASSGNTVATVQTPVVVDPGVTVTDVDNLTLTSATVTVSGGYQSGQDALGFISAGTQSHGNISGTFSAATGVLTLVSAQASATLEQWQAALRAVTFSNSSNTPNVANRTISYVVNDGGLPSAAATKTFVPDYNLAPAFTTAPTPVAAMQGSSVFLNAVVSGWPTPTLQWRRNGVPIEGATWNVLAIHGVIPSDAGSYSLVASNVVQTVESGGATLTVTAAPGELFGAGLSEYGSLGDL